MKKYFVLAALLLGGMTADAKSLVVTLTNGSKVYYLLGGEKNPMMRFVDGKVTVDADEYTLSGIKNFYVSKEDDPTAVEAVEVRKMKAGEFFASGVEAQKVSVYRMDGTKVEAAVSSQDGGAVVSLEGLETGVYVIRFGSESMKVMKK